MFLGQTAQKGHFSLPSNIRQYLFCTTG